MPLSTTRRVSFALPILFYFLSLVALWPVTDWFVGMATQLTTSRGLTFSAGLGIKFYFDQWFSIRFDIRNQVLQQELLGDSAIVNNLTATLGLSVFIPFTP